jgi:hypothetical protein
MAVAGGAARRWKRSGMPMRSSERERFDAVSVQNWRKRVLGGT